MTTMERGDALMGAWRVGARRWRGIIGALLVALVLGGCSVLRIGYGQAPTLAYWSLDGYVDLEGAQGPRLRESLDTWLDWHRRVEMPVYANLLARAQREVMEPMLSPAALCWWRDEANRRLDAALDRATPGLAALMLTLTPQQIAHLERQLAKHVDKTRAEFAQGDRAERAQASFKRTLERYENLYGRLDEAQRAKLSQLLAASPFDADRWLVERERRNRDMVETIRATVARGADGESAASRARGEAAVRLIAERAQRSPRADYRAYQERLAQENCALAAAMHNTTTAAQRQFARGKLKGWEEDVRWIASNGGGSAPAVNNHSR
jgi:Family of unknown function (DUF6279)